MKYDYDLSMQKYAENTLLGKKDNITEVEKIIDLFWRPQLDKGRRVGYFNYGLNNA